MEDVLQHEVGDSYRSVLGGEVRCRDKDGTNSHYAQLGVLVQGYDEALDGLVVGEEPGAVTRYAVCLGVSQLPSDERGGWHGVVDVLR